MRSAAVFGLAVVSAVAGLLLAVRAAGAADAPAVMAAGAPGAPADATGPAGASAAATGAGVFRHFVTRSGDKLMDGPNEFRFIGANMPGMILPYDFTLNIPERMVLATPWEQEDAFKTCVQMNLRAVRWWNLPMCGPKQQPQPWHYVLAPGKFNDAAFKTVDTALALANRYGLRVVLSLSAEAGRYLGGVDTYAAWRGKTIREFWTDPGCKEDFKAALRYVVNRRNSVTGTLYKDDKAILCWEFGNELRSGPDAWQSEMAAYLKSLDPNHLIMDAYDTRVPAEPDPNIDILNRHYYGGDWVKNLRSDLAKARGKRPFVVGEFGLSADVPMVGRFLDAVIGEGAAGAMIWSMYFHREGGGFYWHQIFTHPSLASYHWPGFEPGEAHKEREILAALREAAFRIQGLPLPPVPVPDAPVMLPVGDVPLLSWRGSAGASGYDVQRAGKAGGPWQTVAENVSDGETAYRPLYSDTAVRAGQTVFYRVIARSAAGASPPSDAVGPVTVKGVCFADELKDLSLACGKSEGLKLANDHNGHYAEYLYRAKGDKGDWLLYKMPAAIAEAKVAAFFSESPAADLALEASADGKAFSPLPAGRRERTYAANPQAASGSKVRARTLVEYSAAVPRGSTYLKILWTGPAELDRVELYHPGGQETRK